MKVHCHLCGAALRRPADFDKIRRPDTDDEIVVCSDVQRCDARIAFDPVRGSDPRREEIATRRLIRALMQRSARSI